MSDVLWSHDKCEEPVADLGIDVPRWIEQDISPSTIAAILQGGCASGAYMPAVTYHQAVTTMSEHGDDVLQFIKDSYVELTVGIGGKSWSSIAVHFLSIGVELWASSVEGEIREALEDSDDQEVA